MRDVWVVNASPLISLAKVGQLDLLRQLSRKTLIPEPVAAEVLAGPAGDLAAAALRDGWGTRVALDSAPPALVEWGLGRGETSVLAVALTNHDGVAVLDDAAARACARSVGVPVIGTLGIVVRAKHEGLIESASSLLDALRHAGLYLDDKIHRAILEQLGES